MRRIRPTLRVRVTAAFALFGLSVSLALGGWLYLASRDLELRLIDEALSAEQQDYLARLARNHASLPPDTATIRGYLVRRGEPTADLPPSLAELPPGRHSLPIGGVDYRVAVYHRADLILYMLHNRARVTRREQRFALILAIAVTLVAVLAAAGGWSLAGYAIAPVRRLADRVGGHDAATQLPPGADELADDEVGELARTIEHYVTRLRAFIERERAFVGNASHELRTPLAVIQSTTELLLADDQLPARTRERLERIARATRGMADLTSALLMLARERPGRSSAATPCDVEGVLREAIEHHRPLLAHKPVELVLEVHARPEVTVERPLIAIALANLVRNACTYTERGQVTVTLDAAEVRVRDTGPGVPAAEVRCLLDLEDCRGRSVRGAGIGLPLVKRIANRQGWRLLVESREGEGALFRLRFGGDGPS